MFIVNLMFDSYSRALLTITFLIYVPGDGGYAVYRHPLLYLKPEKKRWGSGKGGGGTEIILISRSWFERMSVVIGH